MNSARKPPYVPRLVDDAKTAAKRAAIGRIVAALQGNGINPAFVPRYLCALLSRDDEGAHMWADAAGVDLSGLRDAPEEQPVGRPMRGMHAGVSEPAGDGDRVSVPRGEWEGQ